MQHKTIDLSDCEKEPVRFIGCIQPFGALLVLDQHSVVTHYSKNFSTFTGLEAQALLGQKFDQSQIDLERFSVSRLKTASTYLLEVEKKLPQIPFSINSHLNALQAAPDLKSLLAEAASRMAEVSGHERVMVYRFHADLHGEVVAEKVSERMDSFMGLHYPASDVPLTSRSILLENWVRMIPDVSQVEVVSLEGVSPGESLDLGSSLLRAVSPIHMEYLRNMRVQATLTVSIIVDGKLWGLFACHHPEARYLTKIERDNCETIGRMTSSLIRETQLKEISYHAAQLKVVHDKLVKKMGHSIDLAKELTESTPSLVDVIKSDGAAAALYMDGQWASVGNVPNETQLNDLVIWLNGTGQEIYSTNELSKVYPEAQAFKHIASGLLATSIPKTNKNFILWFRPEIIETVSWAGRPEKAVSAENGRLHPRASFEEWRESVTGKAKPWESWEIDAATELRNAILGLELRRQYEKEQKARQDAERAVIAREELMAMVSHDLKNPLTSIQMNAQLLKRFIPVTDDKSRGVADRIHKSAVSMNNLIEDILSVTQLEAGQMTLDLARLPLHELIDECLEMLQPIAISKNIKLERHKHSMECSLQFDHGRMLQVFSNIVGNAIKFTPEGGSILLNIEKCGPEFITVSIKDSGPGIPKDHLPNVFDRFWQANQTRRLGTGLGLAIVKGIVERHDGEIWAESELGNGTTFFIKLPSAIHLRS